MKPIDVDVTSAAPSVLSLTVPVRLSGTWRVRVAGALLSLAARVLRTRGSLVPESPPLLFVAKQRLTPEGLFNLRAALARAFTGPLKPGVVIDEPRVEVWQLVAGEWRALEIQRPDADD